MKMEREWFEVDARRRVLTGYTSPVDGFGSSGIEDREPQTGHWTIERPGVGGWEGSILMWKPREAIQSVWRGSQGHHRFSEDVLGGEWHAAALGPRVLFWQLGANREFQRIGI
jgi:hypothetical protein